MKLSSFSFDDERGLVGLDEVKKNHELDSIAS